jgi:hypothetical protein
MVRLRRLFEEEHWFAGAAAARANRQEQKRQDLKR